MGNHTGATRRLSSLPAAEPQAGRAESAPAGYDPNTMASRARSKRSAFAVFATGALACATACANTSGVAAPPRARQIAGVYDGDLPAGGTVTWTLDQTDTSITGAGTYTPAGADSASASYAIRGIMRYDQLTVRLVGAPGDAAGDSLVYAGSFDAELYTAVVFDGTISGGNASPLAGSLQILRQDPTSQ